MTARARNYWKIVEASLVEVYGVSQADAASLTALVISRLGPIESNGGWLYHQEPLNCAADIAGHYGQVSEEQWDSYQSILARMKMPERKRKTVQPTSVKARGTVAAKVLASR
jgi:hypothetical protein